MSNQELAQISETQPSVNATEPRDIQEITQEILSCKAQAENTFLKIGKLLLEAKTSLQMGQWLTWLDENVEISVRSAQRYVEIYKEFADATPVSHLGFTKAYILRAMPKKDRDVFIAEEHVVGGVMKKVADMTKRELETVVRDYLQQKASQRKEIYHNADSLAPAKKESDIVEQFTRDLDNAQHSINQMITRLTELESYPTTRDEMTAKLCNICESTIQALALEDQDTVA